MESGFRNEDLKPNDNTLRNLALAICFSGLFLMIVGVVSAAAVIAFGGSPIVSGISYLLSVAVYLGFIVAALTAAMLTFDEFGIKAPVTKTVRASWKRNRFSH